MTALSLEDQYLWGLIDDGCTIAYAFDELDELTRAYAISIHRSQGSEYPCVVAPLTTSAWVMLQRNLLFYTAVTRAQRLVALVGSRKALARAVRTVGSGRRWTGLAPRLVSRTPNAARHPSCPPVTRRRSAWNYGVFASFLKGDTEGRCPIDRFPYSENQCELSPPLP